MNYDFKFTPKSLEKEVVVLGTDADGLPVKKQKIDTGHFGIVYEPVTEDGVTTFNKKEVYLSAINLKESRKGLIDGSIIEKELLVDVEEDVENPIVFYVKKLSIEQSKKMQELIAENMYEAVKTVIRDSVVKVDNLELDFKDGKLDDSEVEKLLNSIYAINKKSVSELFSKIFVSSVYSNEQIEKIKLL